MRSSLEGVAGEVTEGSIGASTVPGGTATEPGLRRRKPRTINARTMTAATPPNNAALFERARLAMTPVPEAGRLSGAGLGLVGSGGRDGMELGMPAGKPPASVYGSAGAASG